MNVTQDLADLDGHDQLAALMAANRRSARHWNSGWSNWSAGA